MIQQLIEKTNKKEFYQKCNLELENYAFNAKTKIFEIILSINQVSYDEYVEYEEWKIICSNTVKVNGFDYDTMLPYVKITILDDHPLLWLYNQKEIEFRLTRKPGNIPQFIYDLTKMFEEKAGNWIRLDSITRNLFSFPIQNKWHNYSISSRLIEPFTEICNNHNLIVVIDNELSSDYGVSDKQPNAKMLIFGNEDISPNDFNLDQPYIIAERFDAERISKKAPYN